MELSIVVPLYNERDNLAPLHEELARVLGAAAASYEMLFVDDGSTDGSADVLRTIKAGDPHVRVFRLARNSGQTAALACGLHQAAGDVVVAIDGDGENDPADIPRLLAKLAEGYDLVSGWRTERWAGARLSRRLPSVAANRADLVDDRGAAARLRLHAEGLPARPRASPDALWRDASFRPRDRGRAGRAYRRGRGEFPSAPHRQIEVRSGRDRAHFSGPFDGQVSLGLLDAAYSGLRRDRAGDGSDRRDVDSYTGVREDRAGAAACTIGRRCCWRS